MSNIHLEETKERLAQPELSRLKELLWKGAYTQSAISSIFREEFGKSIDQATVSRVKLGRLGAKVPWPDGSTGAIGSESAGVHRDWSTDANRYHDWPLQMQERMLSAVNKQRALMGKDEIPPIHPAYAAMLAADIDTPEREALRMMEAKDAEDRRKSTVMREFDELVTIQYDSRRREGLATMLEETEEERETESYGFSEKALQYKLVSWNEVTRRWPQNKTVIRSVKEKDIRLQTALRILMQEVGWKENDPALIEERSESIRKLLEENKIGGEDDRPSGTS